MWHKAVETVHTVRLELTTQCQHCQNIICRLNCSLANYGCRFPVGRLNWFLAHTAKLLLTESQKPSSHQAKGLLVILHFSMRLGLLNVSNFKNTICLLPMFSSFLSFTLMYTAHCTVRIELTKFNRSSQTTFSTTKSSQRDSWINHKSYQLLVEIFIV